MIRSVRSNQPSFKNIYFKPGFNIILAERTKESTKKDSRNGLGKTTLIEIIHFCFGASLRNNVGIRDRRLRGWEFTLDFDIDGVVYTVTRSVDESNIVKVKGDTSYWPFQINKTLFDDEITLSIDDWNSVLGFMFFDLSNKENDKYRPRFRSVFSYFVRLGRDAFITPFEHSRRQAEWDIQINNAFLLGLNWEYGKQWQHIKDKEKALKELKNAGNSGLMPELLGTKGELEVQKFRLEEKVLSEKVQLDNFKIHPKYRQIEDDANALTKQLHDLINENMSKKHLLDYYRSSLLEENPASDTMVEDIYKESGVIFPSLVTHKLDEIRGFYKRIIENRKSFLENEMNSLSTDISKNDDLIQSLSNKRAELLDILKTYGALDEFTKLQQLYLQLINELEVTKNRISTLKKIEIEKSSNKINKEELTQNAMIDYDERIHDREKAVSLFNSNSQSLYNVPGKLLIDIGSSGYKYQVEIERSTSQGIEQMKIFCYDLMLTQLWSTKGNNRIFLIHDSTIFDGVDERQIANALELAFQEAENKNFQYICCLNSDTIPWKDLDPNFEIAKNVVMIFTDANEGGGLLGVRF